MDLAFRLWLFDVKWGAGRNVGSREATKTKTTAFVYESRIPVNILEDDKVVGRLKYPQNRGSHVTYSNYIDLPLF